MNEVIREKLYNMICEETGIEESLALSDDMRLIENLAFDSVQLISLISSIEDEFDIEFMGEGMLFDRFNRVGDLCDMVKEMIAEKNDNKF